MKINELKQLGEGWLDTAKTLLTDPEKRDHAYRTRAYASYKKKFVDDMKRYFDNAVNSGMINPKLSIKSVTPKTPPTTEEIRKQKQAVATQNARQQMANNPAPQKSQSVTPPTPEEIRKQKQAAATQNAQQQMANNPAPTAPPAGVDPEKVNNAQAAAGLPPVYKKTADGGWEETDQYRGTRVQPKTGGVGPKGRETLARLGKQKQARENPAQGSLDLNESIFDNPSSLDNLVERLVENRNFLNEASGMSPGQAIQDFINNKTSGVNTAKYKKAFDQLAKDFEKSYQQTNKFPNEIADKMFDYYYAVMSSNTVKNTDNNTKSDPKIESTNEKLISQASQALSKLNQNKTDPTATAEVLQYAMALASQNNKDQLDTLIAEIKKNIAASQNKQ